MKILTKKQEIVTALAPARQKKASIGFVPTMGALHAGHIALVRRAVEENDVTVVSIFVNPTQFTQASDLEKYPRTPEADRNMLEEAGATFLFSPSTDEMYPGGTSLQPVSLGNLESVMEGLYRPGHFQGVAHIVRLLFETVQPQCAYFGEKDFQQLAVIRRMVQMEKLPVEIIPCPTVREESGLAMSSRNLRLSPELRKEAAAISKALFWLRDEGRNYSLAEARNRALLTLQASGSLKVEYLEIADETTLQPALGWDQGLRVFAAVNAGEVRLIDNVAM